MRAYIKDTNIELVIYNFIEVSDGSAKCQLCDCRVPMYGNSRELVLADRIELR